MYTSKKMMEDIHWHGNFEIENLCGVFYEIEVLSNAINHNFECSDVADYDSQCLSGILNEKIIAFKEFLERLTSERNKMISQEGAKK